MLDAMGCVRAWKHTIALGAQGLSLNCLKAGMDVRRTGLCKSWGSNGCFGSSRVEIV